MEKEPKSPIIDQAVAKFKTNFSINTFLGRIRLIALFFTTAFLGILAVMIWRNYQAQKLTEELSNLYAPIAIKSSQLLQHLEQATNTQQLYLLTQDEVFRTERQLIWRNKIEPAQQELLELKEEISIPSLKLQIDSIVFALNQYQLLQIEIEQGYQISLKQIETITDTSDTDILHLQKLEASNKLQEEIKQIIAVRVYPAHQSIENMLLALFNRSDELVKNQASSLTASLKNARFIVAIVIISFVLILLFLVRYSLYKTKKAIMPPTQMLYQLAKGKLTEKVAIAKDELQGITSAGNQLNENLTQASHFAQKIGEGNFEHQFTPASQEDTLGNALIQMRNRLVEVSQEDKKRNWLNEGQALFANILRSNNESLQVLSDRLLAELVDYIGANQGGVFMLADAKTEKQQLELIAAYAFDRKKFLQKKVSIGEGLLGQTFLEQESTYLQNIPSEYLQITSGLGGTQPNALLLTPIKLEDEVIGVIELASFQNLEKYQILFVEKIAESMASTLISLRINEKTKKLLEETKEQAEMMQAQEEELRQNNEELAATQEEMKRKQIELEKLKDNLQDQVAIQKDTLQEVSNKEEMLKALINNTEDHIVSIDRKYNIVTFNEAFAKNYRSRNIMIEKGMNLLKLLEVRERNKFQNYYDRALAGEQFSFENKYPINEIELYYENSYNPIRDAKGNITGVSIFSRNITERKLQEEDRQKFVALIESSQDFILMASLQEQILFINEAGKKLIGLNNNEMLKGLQMSDFFIEAERSALTTSVIPLVMEKEVTQRETQIRNLTTNEPIDVFETFLLVKNQATGAPICFAMISRDIREQKIKEEEIRKKNKKLRESEIRFQNITENAPSIIYQLEANIETGEGKFIFVSDFVKEVFDFTPIEFKKFVTSKTFRKYLHQEDFPKFQEHYQKCLKSLETFIWEGRMQAKDGGYKWISAQASARKVDEKIIIFDGLFVDVSEQKIREEEIKQKNLQIAASEEELRQNLEELYAAQEHLQKQQLETVNREAKLNAFINNTKDFIFSFDTDYRVLMANEPFKEFNKERNRELKVNESLLPELMSKKVWENYQLIYERALKGEIFIETQEVQEGRFWELALNPIKEEDTQKVIAVSVIIRDISERKKLENISKKQLEQIKANEAVMRKHLENLMQTKAEIEKQQKLNEGLINSTQDIIIVSNPEMELIIANNAAYVHYDKITPNISVKELFKNEKYHIDFFEKALKGENNYYQHQVAIDGKIIFFETNYFPIQRKNKRIIGVCSISRDISKQVVKEEQLHKKNQQLLATEEELRQNIEKMKTIQEEIQRQQALNNGLLNSSSDTIIVVNPNFDVILVNNKLASTTATIGKQANGYLKSKKLEDLVPKENFQAMRAGYEKALKGEIVHKELKTNTLNGKTTYFSVNFFPLYNDEMEALGACSTARDITERYEQELLIQAKNEELLGTEQRLRNNMENLQEIQWNLEQAKIKTEKESKLFQNILEKTPMALGLINDKAEIEWTNQAFANFTKTNKQFWLNKNLSDYLKPWVEDWQERFLEKDTVFKLSLPKQKKQPVEISLGIYKGNTLNNKFIIILNTNLNGIK